MRNGVTIVVLGAAGLAVGAVLLALLVPVLHGAGLITLASPITIWVVVGVMGVCAGTGVGVGFVWRRRRS